MPFFFFFFFDDDDLGDLSFGLLFSSSFLDDEGGTAVAEASLVSLVKFTDLVLAPPVGVSGTAVGAVCRKLLHRIYIVLKEQRPYVIRD